MVVHSPQADTFDGSMDSPTVPIDSPIAVADLVEAVRHQRAPRNLAPPEPAAAPVRGIAVVGAHPGAGATTVAVALVDALDATGHQTTLVDLAPAPDAFAAAEREVDLRVPGWRAGRRGQIQILRRTHEAESPAFSTDFVVDGRMDAVDSQVLVCRATLPSIRCAEAALSDGVVAVVGVRRWPRVVAASLGPALRRASEDRRIVFVPPDRSLERNGVDAAPLPSGVQAAGRHVIELLWPDVAGPSPTRWRGRPR